MDNWFKKAFRKQAESDWMSIDPSTGKPVWQTHINKFWDTYIEYMPELGGSEFDTGDDYQAREGYQFIFDRWVKEVPEELKVGDQLIPEFKQQVRDYLTTVGAGQDPGRKYKFDPYDDEDEDITTDEGPDDNVDSMSPEELEEMFGQETYDPGDISQRHRSDDFPSPEDLEQMFSEDVYDPGDPEARRRRHTSGEWWE